MRTQTERLTQMHKRADEIKRQGERRRMHLWGAVSAALTLLFAGTIAWIFGRGHDMYAAAATASSLLSENAGGYILAALIAFMVGVVVTVLIIRIRRKRRDRQEGEKHED